MQIEQAKARDLDDILSLFDEVQRWLVGQGRPGQWGTTPISTIPAMYARFTSWVDAEEFFVARDQQTILGTIALTPHAPSYAEGACAYRPKPHLYIEALSVRREAKGQGIGHELLRWAEGQAVQTKVPWLRLDCWAGNEVLRAYYQNAGFAEVDPIYLDGWQGILFEKKVDRSQPPTALQSVQ